MRGRKPIPRSGTLARTALHALPRCPAHLSDVARKEWRRLAVPLYEAGLLTLADRAALAAYCQAYARWVEAEEQLARTPPLLKTPNGHVQQSPWLTVVNKQLELMGGYMTELGLTPVARTRLELHQEPDVEPIRKIEFVVVSTDENGNRTETPLPRGSAPRGKPTELTGPITVKDRF